MLIGDKGGNSSKVEGLNMGARVEDRRAFHWDMALVFSFQFVGHLQQHCSEVAVFSHLCFNSRVMQWSLSLPSLQSLMKIVTLLQDRPKCVVSEIAWPSGLGK